MTTLRLSLWLYHIGKDDRMSAATVRKAFRMVLDRSPVTIRELARRAGVSHVLLLQIRDGKANLTADVAGRLVSALRDISSESARLADRLERATENGGNR